MGFLKGLETRGAAKTSRALTVPRVLRITINTLTTIIIITTIITAIAIVTTNPNDFGRGAMGEEV